MSTSLMIILGTSGAIILFYLLSLLTNATSTERRLKDTTPVVPPYPPDAIFYQPKLPIEERQASRGSFWPAFVVLIIASIFYLAYRGTPAEKATSTYQLDSTATTPARDPGQFAYEYPARERYYDPAEEEEATAYTVPLSTPRVNNRKRLKKAAEPYANYSKEATPKTAETFEAPDYSQGYGVQLFATEKDWWEEAALRKIQQSYPRLPLLIGTGYTRGQVKITKFILGPFDTKAAADDFARSIGKSFSGAYAVELSKLEQVERYWAFP